MVRSTTTKPLRNVSEKPPKSKKARQCFFVTLCNTPRGRGLFLKKRHRLLSDACSRCTKSIGILSLTPISKDGIISAIFPLDEFEAQGYVMAIDVVEVRRRLLSLLTDPNLVNDYLRQYGPNLDIKHIKALKEARAKASELAEEGAGQDPIYEIIVSCPCAASKTSPATNFAPRANRSPRTNFSSPCSRERPIQDRGLRACGGYRVPALPFRFSRQEGLDAHRREDANARQRDYDTAGEKSASARPSCVQSPT